VVNNDVEGIIIQPGNVGELAAAILELYRHPEKVERMSEAARRRVVDNYTWDHFRTRLLVAYEKAMRMGR
jgi:glycosyltransferase involved in cell wall biosynthesis